MEFGTYNSGLYIILPKASPEGNEVIKTLEDLMQTLLLLLRKRQLWGGWHRTAEPDPIISKLPFLKQALPSTQHLLGESSLSGHLSCCNAKLLQTGFKETACLNEKRHELHYRGRGGSIQTLSRHKSIALVLPSLPGW